MHSNAEWVSHEVTKSSFQKQVKACIYGTMMGILPFGYLNGGEGLHSIAPLACLQPIKVFPRQDGMSPPRQSYPINDAKNELNDASSFARCLFSVSHGLAVSDAIFLKHTNRSTIIRLEAKTENNICLCAKHGYASCYIVCIGGDA